MAATQDPSPEVVSLPCSYRSPFLLGDLGTTHALWGHGIRLGLALLICPCQPFSELLLPWEQPSPCQHSLYSLPLGDLTIRLNGHLFLFASRLPNNPNQHQVTRPLHYSLPQFTAFLPSVHNHFIVHHVMAKILTKVCPGMEVHGTPLKTDLLSDNPHRQSQ